ncbi:MAG TPA: bifunctional diaminohydroxyphosphoribosylaminopyrimidine deaminase/5-amino-6-(5-phosphoribosylamino)uracil reductase RibD [Candidatus Methylacidiphilales bacterium]|jgi:diaminohydroxyphosphoribosylaminopyrimidine deaminase/5-amino-6-(5-phosphoribosylamino)uracil reductase|nr:bifunctional diaminohydroxyphosphoribosylaminopyrimidine deaminase/5-amino-6-(5-phosphoribosylamino)uracil reductase RibD [Candidatus Methylacidiphilales bacterium]
MSDDRFLRRALELAQLGSGLTFPNPRVGAVLVRGGKIIGEGFHLRAGTPHAEVHAVANAKKRGHRVEGATLYVTLEPCSTHGRTPPCTGLILREKIARVVFAATDPNPKHAGAAAHLLRKAGVEVSHGLLAKEAAELNRDFNWYVTKKRPWVVAKIALSLDGRITTPPGDDRWLTSPEARRAAHELRWESDAILIGAETTRADNPKLTVRLPGRKGKIQPWRIVITRSGRLPKSLHLFSDLHKDRTLVFRNQTLKSVLAELGRREISDVLIEGGGEILTEAFRQKLVNEVAFFIAPAAMGTATRALKKLGAPVRLRDVRYEFVGPDLLCRALVG